MEHPPKQGLKPLSRTASTFPSHPVLMEHPPKQGLKRIVLPSSWGSVTSFNGTSTKTRIETNRFCFSLPAILSFNGTSTKTRIETMENNSFPNGKQFVLMEHPPKQGLKPMLMRT